ncbi:class I SAM-dependent methyltransferase [Acholeplasma granularum]|uniref:class I SAM-dependent methyltransferase n=1 Tax=Acholeplasma granularum TaxID=264635 RepID=UPI0004724E70|nr:class I SAM-dependent methyltransferase [Acholeplasma granularum]
MKKTNIITIAHSLLEKLINENSVVIDATCGNGHDTLFLASKVKHVHAFDIQEIALNNTKLLTKDYNNITYHLSSFENITKVINYYDGVVFNLGYLPNGDQSITTQHEKTVQTLKQLYKNRLGFVLLVAYPGHKEGLLEQVAIQSFLDKTNIKYEVIRLPYFTKNEAPIIYYWHNN